MNILARFRGTHTEDLHELTQERNALIEQAREHMPEDYVEQLEASEEGEFEHPLEWVEVSDPNSDDPDATLEVQPEIKLWKGKEKDKTPSIEPGLVGIALLGKLPNGEERLIGSIAVIGNREPILDLNRSPNLYHGSSEEWESADAEIFLKLASSALQAQSAQS
ncbi:MAG TPA: hypothetical protein VD947_03130 [Patescibacteria group bacterium]|nr:hypothetical protein [Patescibacteria group bacterium]